MLVLLRDGGGLAEVDFYDLAHDGFAIEDLLDTDGGVIVEFDSVLYLSCCCVKRRRWTVRIPQA